MSERLFAIYETNQISSIGLPTITESDLFHRLVMVTDWIGFKETTPDVIQGAINILIHGDGEKVPRVKRNDGKYAEYDPEQPSPTPTRAEWEDFAHRLTTAIHADGGWTSIYSAILSMPIVPKE
jgi:hypothetical protein